MALVIDLPPTLESKVKAEAQKWKRTPEQIVIDRLAQTFEDDGAPTVAEVVARIKAIWLRRCAMAQSIRILI